MTDDDKLRKIYQRIFTDAMVYGEKYSMQMVASTYLAIAMRIYKTILDPKAYEEMLKTVMESDIQPYKDPKKTVH
jgi:hypothetical protein|tara:strand:+ start:349 stop:573 length:225 start_codon:yes stop_codon:yes gene_type:complete